ncbi:MAG: hypothetical protein C5B49_14715 [Bdellovibrio sp.]|nr:MAG: hypothetical protein C5B49_14715 [Bdellovibrio sp.]
MRNCISSTCVLMGSILTMFAPKVDGADLRSLLSSHAISAEERTPLACARVQAIPKISTREATEHLPGKARWEFIAKTHRRLGPVFQVATVPSWIRSLVAQAARLPSYLGGNTFKRLNAKLADVPEQAIYLSGPDFFAEVARNPAAAGRFYPQMGLERTIGESGLLLLEDNDEVWKATHDLLAPLFSNRRLRTSSSLELIQQVVERVLPGFVASVTSPNGSVEGDERLRVRDFADFTSASVIHKLLFGIDLEWTTFVQFETAASEVWSGQVEDGETRTKYRQFADRYLERIKDTIRVDSIAGELSRKKDEFPDQWWNDQIVTLYFAGQETTRVLLAYGLYELAANPTWQNRFRQPQFASRFRMNFVREVLRLHTVIEGLPRLAKEDVRLGPYLIPRGSLISLNIAATHTSAENFSDPLQFNPDRFENEEVRSFSECPFGFGKRICIGQHLASFEAETVFAYILAKYQLELVDDQEPATDSARRGPSTVQRDFSIRLRARSHDGRS